MKISYITSLTSLCITTTFAAPAPAPIEYAAPPGGWESVKYPKGTGEGLPSYPAPPGGWENVKYPPGTGASPSPFSFTSTFNVVAKGDQVRNGTTPAPGSKDGIGYFNFGINSNEDTICFNITLLSIPGTYLSPALTATHIHAAARGASGPPRIAFPNPISRGSDARRVSVGCLTGPFTTGIKAADGSDTGAGFKVAMIEANPERYFADVHTSVFPLGAVRGQIS
ncbi:hypothetical protein BP5796_11042 [Coleophoma crateriformis]|uniref:CHRD domain-containing protein n=1 Tax=Coleophoma crateriformis TaxID=565419 RepID=A0A3D8QM66_9HELO|nr:hypothetical protein BP5796_11042 [Coleophoma crateriformis]